MRRFIARPWRTLRDYLSLIRFSHTLFAMPFAALGAILASHVPAGWRFRAREWLGILLCMVFARSASMAFNRLADRRFDAANPRTADRHLPTGQLSVFRVTAFTIVCSVLFVASTLLFLPLNPWPVVLAIPTLLWCLGYSFAKRFTSLSHFWLGSALALTPLAAWVAIRGGSETTLVPPPMLFLALAVVCWVAGFDILYSCLDADHDLSAGLHSLPARLGVPEALNVARGCHGAMVVFLYAFGRTYGMGPIYFTGAFLIAGLLVAQHLLVRPNDLRRVNIAFFNLNVIISLALVLFSVVDLLLGGGQYDTRPGFPVDRPARVFPCDRPLAISAISTTISETTETREPGASSRRNSGVSVQLAKDERSQAGSLRHFRRPNIKS